MDFLNLWAVVRRRWWLLVLPMALVFLLTLPSLPSHLRPQTQYNLAMRFTAATPADFITREQGGISYEDSAYIPWLASEYIVVNLPQWITSDSFAEAMRAHLSHDGLNFSLEQLRGALAADSARSILVVYITWPDAAELERIASAAITTLQTQNQNYFPQFAASPAEIVPLDGLRIQPIAPPLMTRLSPLLRLGIAFLAGFFLLGAAHYFDDSLWSAADLEPFELPIIALIPRK